MKTTATTWTRERAQGTYGDGKPLFSYRSGHWLIERCDIDEREEGTIRQWALIDTRTDEEVARSLWTLAEAKAEGERR